MLKFSSPIRREAPRGAMRLLPCLVVTGIMATAIGLLNGSDMDFGNLKYTASAVAGESMSGSWAFQVLPFIGQFPMFKQGPAGPHLAAGVSRRSPLMHFAGDKQ